MNAIKSIFLLAVIFLYAGCASNENRTDTYASSMSDSSSGYVELAENPKDFIKLAVKRNEYCGPVYSQVFLQSKHDSKKIRAKIKVVAKYLNETTTTYQEKVIRSNDELFLGCNGFDNPTGADTTYKYSIVNAWFE